MVKKIFKKIRAIPVKQNAFGSKKLIKQKKPQHSLVQVDLASIKCKAKRNDIFFRRKKELKRLKNQTKQTRKEEEEQGIKQKQTPNTVDNQRELGDEFVFEEDEELLNEEKFDEFSNFFNSDVETKILITSSIKPPKQMFEFLLTIKSIFPNAYYYPRKLFTVKEITTYAKNRNFTDLMIWRESRKKVDEMILIHLPDGPTAIFKITNIKMPYEIHHHGNPTDHHPELILNNFNTNVGRRIGRFFASLFPQKPEFKGRTVVTFHNQRDFIFFRRHRYIFGKEFEKVNLQEIGPRFTLKLKKLQKGLYDDLMGKFEFQGKADMYISRKKFYL